MRLWFGGQVFRDHHNHYCRLWGYHAAVDPGTWIGMRWDALPYVVWAGWVGCDVIRTYAAGVKGNRCSGKLVSHLYLAAYYTPLVPHCPALSRRRASPRVLLLSHPDLAPLHPLIPLSSTQPFQARLCSLLMVSTTFVLLPWQTSKLIELLSSRDPFSTSFVGSSRRPHVIVSSRRLTASSLSNLAAQLRCLPGSDLQAETDLQLLVLSPHAPDAHTRTMLVGQHHPVRLHWLVGSSLSRADLQRVDVANAIAAFVVADDPQVAPQTYRP